MILEADGKKYAFHFSHRQDSQHRWVTACSFHEGTCKVKGCPAGVTCLGCGVSVCSLQDQFSKRKGRKRAMARAFGSIAAEHAGKYRLPRDTRRQLWQSYFRQIAPPIDVRGFL